MPPTFNLNISGNAVAAYGAILSTATAAIQLNSHMRDKVKVKITVGTNMRAFQHPKYHNTTRLIQITVTNVGRRTVTITSIGARLLYPNDHFIVVDTSPVLPCELTEGKYITSLLPQTEIDVAHIYQWTAWDSTGKMHKLNTAPWLTRKYSEWQTRRDFKKAKKPGQGA